MKLRAALLAGLITCVLGPGTAHVVAADGTVDDERPGAPQPLQVTSETNGIIDVQWRRSTDDTGIAFYRLFDRGELAFEWRSAQVDDDPNNPFIPTVVPIQFDEGVHWFQMQAVDLAGNESVRTSPVRYVIGRERPSAAYGLTATVEESVVPTQLAVGFTITADDLATCTLLRNLVPRITFDPGPVPDGPPRYTVRDVATPDRGWYQVQCTDAAGNQSVRSAPVFFPGTDATT